MAIACLSAVDIMGSAIANNPIKRTVLRSIDYPVGYTTVTAFIEIALALAVVTPIRGRQRLSLQGDFVLKSWKPDQTFKAGNSFETSPQTGRWSPGTATS